MPRLAETMRTPRVLWAVSGMAPWPALGLAEADAAKGRGAGVALPRVDLVDLRVGLDRVGPMDLRESDAMVLDRQTLGALPTRLQLGLAAAQHGPAVVLIEDVRDLEQEGAPLQRALRMALEGYDVLIDGSVRRRHGPPGYPGEEGDRPARTGLSRAARLEMLRQGLSETEFGALQSLGRGASNRQLARELDVSEAAAKAIVRTLLQKLGLSNRTQAAVMLTRLDTRERAAAHSGTPLRSNDDG